MDKDVVEFLVDTGGKVILTLGGLLTFYMAFLEFSAAF